MLSNFHIICFLNSFPRRFRKPRDLLLHRLCKVKFTCSIHAINVNQWLLLSSTEPPGLKDSYYLYFPSFKTSLKQFNFARVLCFAFHCCECYFLLLYGVIIYTLAVRDTAVHWLLHVFTIPSSKKPKYLA